MVSTKLASSRGHLSREPLPLTITGPSMSNTPDHRRRRHHAILRPDGAHDQHPQPRGRQCASQVLHQSHHPNRTARGRIQRVALSAAIVDRLTPSQCLSNCTCSWFEPDSLAARFPTKLLKWSWSCSWMYQEKLWAPPRLVSTNMQVDKA